MSAQAEPGQELDEYSQLIQFISNYRDENQVVEEEEDDEQGQKAPWYAPWKKGKKGGSEGAFVAPDSWLHTDLKQGLPSSEIENRRKKAGWNEITAEKENMLLKFIGFFRGPVLYGKSHTHTHTAQKKKKKRKIC